MPFAILSLLVAPHSVAGAALDLDTLMRYYLSDCQVVHAESIEVDHPRPDKSLHGEEANCRLLYRSESVVLGSEEDLRCLQLVNVPRRKVSRH